MDQLRHSTCAVIFALSLCGLAFGRANAQIDNGSFERRSASDHRPDGWYVSGDKAVMQEFMAEQDPKRGQVACLRCTRFVYGTSSSHAMIAQSGRVTVQRGHWYRLSLWARASDLESGTVQVSLVNSRTFSPSGLSVGFAPGEEWQRFEFVFAAERDVKAAQSRLAIFFLGTGILWLDDVTLEETEAPAKRWSPEIPMDGISNALVNSSFEGGEGWGTWATKHFDWPAGVSRRLGIWDDSQAFHGNRSWKVMLSGDNPLKVYGGYTQEAAEIRILELGHTGWIRVKPGQSYVFSMYVMSDRAAMPIRIQLREPKHSGGAQQTLSVGSQWQRIEVSYTPRGDLLRGSLRLDLPSKGSQTLWMDAAQFERGTSASSYRPRYSLEAGIDAPAPGNHFTDPAQGMSFRLRAFNHAKEAGALRGRIRVTDFWDQTVWEEKLDLPVGAEQAAERPYTILAGRRGFFRIHFEPEDGLAQQLRCAIIDPYKDEDSVFGYNHAFGEDFLLPMAHQAGLRWWRDWSTQWDVVQASRDAAFDFHRPDIQINRVLGLDGRMLILLPFPSSIWSPTADSKREVVVELERKGASSARQLREAVRSCKPERLEDFAAYVAATVKHYRGRVSHYEILNEPLYTHYSLPVANKYTMSDYLDILRTAYEAAKAADPICTVIGGIACEPGEHWVEQFIAQGGLRWCDAMNYHTYPTTRRPEALENALQSTCQQMRERGEPKPIWVTEFGLYAEDDPLSFARMHGTTRANERTASVELVQWASVLLAHGARKILYHSGTCPNVYSSGMHNIFFEYGGAPRKMYPAIAAMSRILGPEPQFVRKWSEPRGVLAYEFRGRGRNVVILWTRKLGISPVDVPTGFQAFDFMGNRVEGRQVIPGETPLYFVGKG